MSGITMGHMTNIVLEHRQIIPIITMLNISNGRTWTTQNICSYSCMCVLIPNRANSYYTQWSRWDCLLLGDKHYHNTCMHNPVTMNWANCDKYELRWTIRGHMTGNRGHGHVTSSSLSHAPYRGGACWKMQRTILNLGIDLGLPKNLQKVISAS